MEYDSRIPGYEALGFCSPSNSAFIVRADALQKCSWLPMYSRAPHLALGQELKLQEYLCHYINMPLAVGESLPLLLLLPLDLPLCALAPGPALIWPCSCSCPCAWACPC